MRERPAIWVVGSTMVDMIAFAARIPAAGETVVGERFDLGCGGKGANQAVMAARLGAAVTVVNAVGSDPFGRMSIANLRREGIDVRHVATIEGESSGLAPIWVEPDGTNRIIVIPGANRRMDPGVAAAAVVGARRVDVVIGQLEIPQEATLAAFRAARNRGALTVLNPAPIARLVAGLHEVTDWMVLNETEVKSLADDLAVPIGDLTDAHGLAALRARLGTGLVVTLGAEGATAITHAGEYVRVQAPTIAAVDTTGAGDAFVGGFAYALARGARPDVAVRVGCALATDSVRRPGTQKSFPERRDARLIAQEAGLRVEDLGGRQ